MACHLSFLLVFLLSGAVLASIGPVSDLHVVSKEIAPDGFLRPSVSIFEIAMVFSTSSYSAALAGATPQQASFPGPVIKGYKVCATVVCN